jgi:hypothetical protein
MLCIVQYNSGVGLVNNELAFVRSDGDYFDYTFSSGRNHRGSISEFSACNVTLNENVLHKKTFNAVFQRDFKALKERMENMSDTDAAVGMEESNTRPI